MVVYADQDRHEALNALKPERKDEPTFRAVQGSLGAKRRKKRSLSFDYERVVFTDQLDTQPRVSAQALPKEVLIKPSQLRQ